MAAGSSKESQLAELLAKGYTEDDLTWIPEDAPVAIDLVYVQGQDPQVEFRKAVDRMRGSWVIKTSAVVREIRKVTGRSDLTVDEILSETMFPFLRRIRGVAR